MVACYRRRRRPALAALLLTALPAVTTAAPLALREVCDASTPVELLGVDTAARRVLVSLPSERPGIPRWLVEVGEAGATLYPDFQGGERFGGSTGPGPVLAFERCGDGCAQVVAWGEGSWRPVGPPLDTDRGATVHLARDGGGHAWLAQHLPGGGDGTRRVVAARLAGERWEEAGTLEVAGVGSPAVVPDPEAADALLSGSGRFRPGHAPETWVRMPPLAPETRGTLVPLGGGRAAFLAGDSRLLITRDGGSQWFEQRWTPWPREPGPTRWDRGEHYWLDLPTGTVSDPLGLLWFDDRPGHSAGLWLTGGEGPEDLVVAAVPRSPAPGAEPVLQAIRWGGDEWLLLAGCRRDERTAYLLARRPAGGDAGSWRRLPLAPGW